MESAIRNRKKIRLLNRLLSIGVMFTVLLGLMGAGIATAAPGPAGAPYIIVFKDTVNPGAEAPGLAKAYGLQPGFVYQHALKGMSAIVPEGRLVALQHDPRVAYVEPDMEQHIEVQSMPTGIQRIFAGKNSAISINGIDDYRVDVDVAVIDTGVDFQHPDLNVVGGVTCSAPFIFWANCSTGGDDDHYHGTHVAGTIGALDNGIGVVGVAPGARIWAVKVLNSSGSGYSSQIVAGIEWVADHATTIEVANMSLGGAGFSQAEYDAIQGAVNLGVAFAVAAGNDDADARNYSPGGFNNVLSVSALADFDGIPGGLGSPTCRTDQDDTLADFSNWGPEVDVAAPGVCILSTYPLEQGEYGTISGTSMASPHAAGALALLASRNNPNNSTDVYNLYNQVKSTGNYNWTDDSGDGIQEPLLDVSNIAVFNPVLVPGSGSGSTNTPPIVSITNPANGSTFASGTIITFTGTATDAGDGNLTASLIWTSDLDGQIGTGGSFTNSSLKVGIHTITATVTDSGGLTSSAMIIITVTTPPVSQITLIAVARQVKTNKYVDLTWSVTVSANVDVYRNGVFVITTPNDGAYTDKPSKTITSATYKVCEVGTTTCSNEVTVSW